MATQTVLRTAVITALLVSGAFAQEYHVEASRNAIVRSDPDRDAEMRLRLTRGEHLNAVSEQQTDRFYHVFLPNGDTGWVSSYVVRLHEGPSPQITGSPVVTPSGGALTAAERRYAEFHLALGKPKGYVEIVREGYVVGYDPKLKIPVWTQYRLTRAHSQDNTFGRTNSFREDAVVPPQSRAVLADYRNSGYARGHMAPANDMQWSETVEGESNLLTNIAPQVGSSFNGSIWGNVESRIRGWVLDREDLTIICGPVFESRDRLHAVERQPQTDNQMLYNVIGPSNVAVPSAFFKIVVDATDPANPDVIAFVMPHLETVAGPERTDIEQYLRSVDDIESLTGLDFLTDLPSDVQRRIEEAPAPEMW